MIRLHMSAALLGTPSKIERRNIPWDGCTVRQLVERERPREWGELPIQVAVDGALIEGDDLDRSLPDDVDVVIAPAVHGIVEFLGLVLLASVVSAGLNYLASLLIPTPKPPGVAQDRGDISSPTYAWDGIQTNYGQGLTIGKLYGEHDVGGQVIYTSVLAQTSLAAEQLNIILAISGGGRIESIGGVTGGPNGEADGLDGTLLNPLPANIRVNENEIPAINGIPGQAATARAWIRCGEYEQSALPAPFIGAATTFLVNEAIDDVGELIFTYADDDPIDIVAVIIKFPAGVYQQDNFGSIAAVSYGRTQPNPFPPPATLPLFGVQFIIDWRPAGSGAGFQTFYDISTGGNFGPFQCGTSPVEGVATFTFSAKTRQFSTSAPVHGPIEIRLRRTDPHGSAPNATFIDAALWRQVFVAQLNSFAYPGTAMLGLELQASEKISGGLPKFQLRAKGTRVRVWDQTLGWSDPVYEVASLPTQWRFMTYAPGSNPAWVALDWLLSPEGMGRKLTEENIDLPAFRAWAVFCDNDPGPVGFQWAEPRFRFDGVMDKPRPAWEWLTMICAAGRAAPLWRGNKVSVVYQYRDAHSDSGATPRLTVPAKTKTQVFSDANVTDLEVEYVSRGGRPSVIAFAYINAAQDYRLDEFQVEETESYYSHLSEFPAERFEDLRRERIEAFGVTRSTQLYREGVFRHRLNRMVRSIITFRTGIWALAAEPGDLIGFQHDVLRPYANQSFGLTIEKGVVNGLVVTVDRVLTPTGGTDKLIMRGPAGQVVEATVAGIAGKVVTLTTPIAVDGVAATSVSVNPGAACAFGRSGQVLKEYTILDINLDRDGMRVVRAVEFQPLAFEEPRVGSGGSLDNSFSGDPGQSDSHVAPQRVDPADIRVTPSISTPGAHLISWAKPAGRTRYRCRVYARPLGATHWWHLGEVRGEDSRVEWAGMAAGERWQVVVGVEDDRGQFAMPHELEPATIATQEFPPIIPPMLAQTGGSNRREARGYSFAWHPVHFAQLAGYEMRVGTEWVGAQVIYAGQTPRFFWDQTPKFWDKVMIAAKLRSGLYGPRLEIAQPAAFLPEGLSAGASDVVEVPPVAAVPPELEYDAGSGAIRVKAGFWGATFTSLELDLGSPQEAWWSVSAAMEQRDDFTIDEVGDFEVGSGEATWRTANAREASVYAPGLVWDETIDDIGDVPIDDLGARTFAGWPGMAGEHVQFKIETRFHDGSSWGSWGAHTNGIHTAQKMQARFTLMRDHEKRNGYVRRFTLSVAV